MLFWSDNHRVYFLCILYFSFQSVLSDHNRCISVLHARDTGTYTQVKLSYFLQVKLYQAYQESPKSLLKYAVFVVFNTFFLDFTCLSVVFLSRLRTDLPVLEDCGAKEERRKKHSRVAKFPLV